MTCERCNNSNAKLLFLSVFNEQNICVFCKEKEEKHPGYKKAVKEIEIEEANGNYDFKGIGLPKELIEE